MMTVRRWNDSSLLVLVFTALLLGVGLIGCSSGGPEDQAKGTQAVPENPREGTVRSIREADEDLQAETTAKDYRIGATFVDSQTIYNDTQVASAADEGNHQLRLTLRDQRTKRYLPGADVEVTLRGPETEQTRTLDLLETWGSYHFYGSNVDVPPGAELLDVTVQPPRVGRHADLKERYRESVEVEFPLEQNGSNVVVQGADPEPVADDVTLGSSIAMGLEEALSVKETGSYRVGFIAEHSEPYWVPAENPNDTNPGTLNLTMADFPQSANRHLEIVLYDRESNRILPHADIQLNVADGDEIKTRTDLPFLLAAFYHYGNSVYLPEADYTIEATLGAPSVHTLEKSQFPDEQQATFSWSPENEEGESGEHEAEY